MKANKLCLSLLLLSVLIFTSSCAGLGDWSLKLPNNYEMWRINSESIVIGYKDSEDSLSYNENGTMIGIDGYVEEFCFNDNFIGAKQINKEDKNDSKQRYYLIDTSKKKVYGPFSSEDEFNNECVRLNIINLTKWEKTSPSPKNAIYPEPMSTG